ncbi:Amine oxidase [Penicillium cf. griseofulvum]|uniref:Amine oxidase n=1 Tax=Penicillium cf. griseofulvum TaxID=2972120 RepID=A0A9W9MZX7_9EURO|nr:Amine oxidase [Penicillium cf. griseofulvum]KAJ5421826.1 Amine oxidase [Penicillium cf. griseofulvum]KAJ5428017.1 Amine oxidase [Penicillium cf. griseofulvum]
MQFQLPYRELFSWPSIRVSLCQDPLEHPGVHSFECHCCPDCSKCGPDNLGVTRTEKIVPSVLTSYQEESSDPPLDKNTKVCIIGAGIAGLYLALILQDLEIPNLSWDILEAHRDRIGGRIYTHRFSEAHNDYYDVGAMRFPDIPIMSRVFDLFHRMEVPLKEFHMRERSTNTKGYDNSKTQDSLSANLLDQSFGPYKKVMQRDFVQGFQLLMQADAMSTREYLRGNRNSDFTTIQAAESNTTGTGTFDQAFSESVMDSFDLDQPSTGSDESGPGIKWYSVDGGSSVVIDRMCHQIKRNSTIELGKQVRRITLNRSADLSVSCAGEEEARDGYATVFSTTPLACLQRIDTESLHLDPIQKEAIRCLRYEDSTKVGIKFAYPWWIVDCGLRGGGSASSTLPSRTCVYPSHIAEVDWNKPAVLLASYTWGQDATRMGALISPPCATSDGGEDDLLDLVLRDLAQQHRQYGVTYEKLQSLYLDHHAFCWGNSRFSSGAFALFAPGQFTNLYPSLSLPAADGKFHIVGEAASVHHGWVVGSLNSAYAAVYRFLLRYGQKRAIQKLEKNWGTVHELDIAGVASLGASI